MRKLTLITAASVRGAGLGCWISFLSSTLEGSRTTESWCAWKKSRGSVFGLYFPLFLEKHSSSLLHISMLFNVLSFLKHPHVNKFIQRINLPVSKPTWILAKNFSFFFYFLGSSYPWISINNSKYSVLIAQNWGKRK